MGMIWVGYRSEAERARAILLDPDALDDLLGAEDESEAGGLPCVDIDKSWAGLHWLLAGEVGPTDEVVSQAILGGEPIGEDLGYGPARLLLPPAVQAVAEALAVVEETGLRSRLDGAAMEEAGVYPSICDEDDVFETYLWPHFEELRDFYLVASRMGDAVIQTIC